MMWDSLCIRTLCSTELVFLLLFVLLRGGACWLGSHVISVKLVAIESLKKGNTSVPRCCVLHIHQDEHFRLVTIRIKENAPSMVRSDWSIIIHMYMHYIIITKCMSHM